MKLPAFTETSSATSTGREIDRSASSRVIHVRESLGREIIFHTDNGMRFMLAPRSARAKHSSILEKSHGMRNFPRPPIFSDGYGIHSFGLSFGALTGASTGSITGATTGSEFGIYVATWTTEDWTSLVLPLLVGGIVSFVTSVSRSTTLGGEEVVGIVGGEEEVGIVGLLYAIPLRVVIPFKSCFGLVMVLLGDVLKPEDEASQLVVEESGLAEPELGNPRLDNLVLDKLEAGRAYAFHQDKASSVRVPVANVTLFSLAHLLREKTGSVRSNQRIRPTAPSAPLK
uniref:Uncharacterized protein n=1 Tax=Tanacetum cinerariifolium TaxID=118510 RepID=A0A6L2LNR0_TANCI|nr:hypothetical protein [Tanacetum cinerariifolium]